MQNKNWISEEKEKTWKNEAKQEVYFLTIGYI